MQICSQVDDYLAGRLNSADTQAFEAHGLSCEACGKAVARRRAVERAASVMRRNQSARVDGVSGGPAYAPAVTLREQPASDVAPPPEPARVSAAKAKTIETPRPFEPPAAPRSRGKIIGVLVLVGGVGLLWWALSGKSPEPPVDAAPPTATETAPTSPAPPSEVAPSPPPQDTPTPTPVEPTLAAPVVAAPTAPEPAPAPVTKPAQLSKSDAAAAILNSNSLESLPADTDIDILAQVIQTRRCGIAIAALRTRVARNRSDARSWGLLTQCYARRKRWQNALDSYDQVVAHGDAALIASLESAAEQARAGLEAAAAAPAAPADTAATPTPTE